MSKHTPGPWQVDEYTSGNSMFGFSPACVVMCRDNNKVICEIPDFTVGQFDREDARLIAAAPDYHEAAIAILKAHDEDAVRSNFARCGCGVCSALRPIIAKATGE